MHDERSEDQGNTFSKYQRSVRDDANRTLDELRDSISPVPMTMTSQGLSQSNRFRAKERSVSPRRDTTSSPEYIERQVYSSGRPRRSQRHQHQRGQSQRTSLARPPQEGHNSRHQRSSSTRSPGPNDYSYRAAVERLREMLNQKDAQSDEQIWSTPKPAQYRHSERSYSPEIGYQRSRSPTWPVHGHGPPRSPPPIRRTVQFDTNNPPLNQQVPSMSEMPNQEEILSLLQKQALYIQHMEGENKYCKEEFEVLKTRLQGLVLENGKLYEQVKAAAIQEIMKEKGGELPQSISGEQGQQHQDENIPKMDKKDMTMWKKELSRLSAMHAAKTQRLEAQLSYTKSELGRHEKIVEDLKSRLRTVESLPNLSQSSTHGGSTGYTLCVICAKNEALLPQYQGLQPSANLEKITKERDELTETITQLKARLDELKKNEEDSYEQVKKSLELVEAAQLDKTQALVQSEQLREEVSNSRQRMEQLILDGQKSIQEERKIVRKECELEMNELNSKVKELLETNTTLEAQIEKVTREKMSTMAELQQSRHQIQSYDDDYNRSSSGVQATLTQAKIERDIAVKDITKVAHKLERLKRDKEQDEAKLRSELEDVRRRLLVAEKELMSSKEECIQLTTTNQALEREAHLAKISKESIERGRSDEIKNVTRRATQREEELNMLLNDTEARHSQSRCELEEMLDKQNSLVGKLREECRRQAGQIEQITSKYRNESRQIRASNEELTIRLEKALRKISELDNQHVQHGRVHEKMRQRLRQMDEHAQHSAQQIVELLNKQGTMMKDRQMLAREVEFLRKQMKENASDIDKLYSSHKQQVDDILENVNHDES
ncbi:unnamed protein product [Owenia fusiformis]|uniref:Uncharacterized protein n=1 Tax=Owenia fusiformis TaxID=6347 RepID=A0A8J1XXQ3_OWEFU|nr:unnamed protein product [Owenia fusiformis]